MRPYRGCYRHSVTVVAVLALGLIWVAHPGSAFARTPDQTSCFFLQQWKGAWKVSTDARSIYIEAGRRVYRLDLDVAHPLLKSPFALLADKSTTNVICSPMDFRLVVSNRIGTTEAVIVRKMTPLTAAEVAALPKKLRP